MKKKLKICATTWHIMHFWDLFNALKEIADFYLINNIWRSWRKAEFLAARSIPDNVQFVPYYVEGKYDFAILDIDQQCINKKLGKSIVYQELNERIKDIPKVVINHGAPVYPEFIMTTGMTKQEAEQECRDEIKKMIGNNLMIVNSFQSVTEKEWGFGYPIWHGLNDKEWLDLPKEPRIFTALSPAGCEEYYNRDCLNEIIRKLKQIHNYELYWAKMNVKTDNSENDYKTFLGSSLIYIDVSFRTPMNRARTEAMLSGCCVVQVKKAHDLDLFVKDKENIILVDNEPEQIANILVDLIENRYDEAIKIGQAGKENAKKLFNRERYKNDWIKLIIEELKIKL
jgi:hypothetical protein